MTELGPVEVVILPPPPDLVSEGYVTPLGIRPQR